MVSTATLTPASTAEALQKRLQVRVSGIVQGVGFRPFVYRLATQNGLSGLVFNDAAGVMIEVEGEPSGLSDFMSALRVEAPPRSRIDQIVPTEVPTQGAHGFSIVESRGGQVATAIGPDTSICSDCLREMFTRADRRWRYPFINCTHCGPRYTITRDLPYDRAQTSMAKFALCPSCDSEYRNVADRRFHAEPNACPICGPQLSLCDAQGQTVACNDVITEALRRLRAGEVLAIKGLGGFHLACDARNAEAVRRLRDRKQREEKPFAVMTANLQTLSRFANIDAASSALLHSAERPVVLLPKTAQADAVLAGIAPGVAWLGAMLPYTPLQYLLFHEAAGSPEGLDWMQATADADDALMLVMTSANPHGEPLVHDNAEAVLQLAGIADAYVMHDRDIVVRCDDSVIRPASDGAPQFIRRARGYTPVAIQLTRNSPAVLAMGGWFKNTVCLTRGREAFVSQHIGDLDNAQTCRFLEETVEHFRRVLQVSPHAIAHDLHPDFHSSQVAAGLANALGVPCLGVQHHHAHIASVLAEHQIDEPTLGLALDGVGLGSDGGAWGGELLLVKGAEFERLGHLRTLPLAGGDRAAREPWRVAAGVLHQLGQNADIASRFANRAGAATVAEMLQRQLNTPHTSSMGRWFDAAAGLLGLRDQMSFEGQAAMELEGHAASTVMPEKTLHLWAIGGDNVLDLLPLMAQLAEMGRTRSQNTVAEGAALFHAALADALSEWVIANAQRLGLRRVAGAGGCFLNALLVQRLRKNLQQQGIELVEARALPPNDGGLSLGQAWVAQRALFAMEG